MNKIDVIVNKLDKIIDLLTPKEIGVNSLISVTSSNENSLQISATKLKNLEDCWIAIPSQLDSKDWKASYIYKGGFYTIILTNEDTGETLNLNSSIHTTPQTAIDAAYEWFKERNLDVLDLNNWVVHK